MNSKIKKLALGLKICLVIILLTLAMDFLKPFLKSDNEIIQKIGPGENNEAQAIIKEKDSLKNSQRNLSLSDNDALQMMRTYQKNRTKIKILNYASIAFFLILGLFLTALLIMIFKNSFSLIRKIERGQLFDTENLPIIKKLGSTLVIFGVLEVGGKMLAKFLDDLNDYIWPTIVGFKEPSSPIDINFTTIILGIVILITSAILKETILLKQEQDLTI